MSITVFTFKISTAYMSHKRSKIICQSSASAKRRKIYRHFVILHFIDRKYNDRQWCPTHWVFGGNEWGWQNSFLIYMPDWWAVTLKEAIVVYVQAGRHTVSYFWDAYHGFKEIKLSWCWYSSEVFCDHCVKNNHPRFLRYIMRKRILKIWYSLDSLSVGNNA